MYPNFKILNFKLPALRCLKPIMQAPKKLYMLAAAFFLFNSFLFAQQNTISGKVVDEQSNPLIGASVKIAGTQQGITTSNDGSFTISATKAKRWR